MFDLAPLTQQHFWLFGISFFLTAAAIVLLARPTTRWLRRVPNRPIYYTGSIIAGVTATLVALVFNISLQAIGVLLAAAAICWFGARDEHRPVGAFWQLLIQFIVAGVVVGTGWTISQVTNPFTDGVIHLNWVTTGLLVWPGSILGVLWLVLLMNTMNWLDGIDGLASVVGLVTLATLTVICLLPQIQDSTTLSLSVIGAGSMLGFFLWNVPPARVYLGTVGSWWLGLYIGIVAMAGGGKVATTLLVLALPIVDTISVIVQRGLARKSVWRGDKRHLHHRLLAYGFSPRQVVAGTFVVSAVLGFAAIVLQTQQKFLALGIAAGMVVLVTVYLILHSVRLKNDA